MVTVRNLQDLVDNKETTIVDGDLKILVKQNKDLDYDFELYNSKDIIGEDYPIDTGTIKYKEDENLVEITNEIMSEVETIKNTFAIENYSR